MFIMKFMLIIFFALTLGHSGKCQEVGIRQYSFYCESTSQVNDKFLQERIKSIRGTDQNMWKIEAIILDVCNIRLFPIVRMRGDTLVVNTDTIERQELKLSKGDRIVEYSQPEECKCAYELRMELQEKK